MALSTKQYRAITSRLFAAALDPAEWSSVLRSLGDALPGAKLHLFAHDIARQAGLGILHEGHDPDYIACYEAYYSQLNPYPMTADTVALRTVVELEEVVPTAHIERTEYFNDWMRPQENLTNGTGLILDRSDSSVFILGTVHPDKHRDTLDFAARTVLETLVPELTASWRLSRIVGEAAFEQDTLASTAARGIVALVDVTGRPVYMNAAARESLEDGTWLRQDLGGRIHLTDPDAEAHLRARLQAVEATSSRQGSSAVTLRVDGRAAACELAVLTPDDLADWSMAFVLGLNRPTLMIAISPERCLNQRFLSYGFSTAETDVVEGLVRGMSPREIADGRDVSIHTVRHQIKNAMAKAGVASQAQLVALITLGVTYE